MGWRWRQEGRQAPVGPPPGAPRPGDFLEHLLPGYPSSGERGKPEVRSASAGGSCGGFHRRRLSLHDQSDSGRRGRASARTVAPARNKSAADSCGAPREGGAAGVIWGKPDKNQRNQSEFWFQRSEIQNRNITNSPNSVEKQARFGSTHLSVVATPTR